MFLKTADATTLSKIGERLNLDVEKWANKRIYQPAFKAKIIKSEVAAGDTSIATFLAAARRGFSPEKCIALAAAQGACCVTASDAISGLKTLDELIDQYNI